MPSRIRVVELVKDFEALGDGIGRFVAGLSRALDPGRFEVRVGALWRLGTALEGERIRQLNAEGITAFTAAPWDAHRPIASFWLAFRTLQAALARVPADILHSHSEFSDVAVLLLKLRPHPPIVMRTVHYGYHHEWRKRPLRRLFLTNLLYPLLFDREIGVSQSVVETLNQRPFGNLLGRQALCIYNAIDLERFSHIPLDRAEKRRSLDVPADAPLIGTVGRLAEQKGYAFVVEAAASLLGRLANAHFLIVGEGELREALTRQALRLGIAAHVHWAGARDDVEELLACMDLFVSASLWEGLPTAIMESMAAGIPVVATDIPGTRELIQHQVTGWLVPPGDSGALSEAILAALAPSHHRQEIARRAREAVRRFSMAEVAKKYEALYQAAYEPRSTRSSPTSST